MKYSVHPSVWSNAFAVPTQLVDKHLKIASGQQLKVFLWLVRHSADEFDFDAMVKGVGMRKDEVKDNMQYWIEKGLVTCDDNIVLKVVEKDEPKAQEVEIKKPELKEELKQEPKEIKKELSSIPDVLPTHDQVAKRLLESNDLKLLYNEAQTRLGKTIGYDTQAKLLMIHDHYGLPVEVILMIIEYAVIKGKPSMAYITKVAKDWGERDINTLDRADEQIQRLCQNEQIWKDFSSMFTIDPPRFTDNRCEYLIKWNKHMGISLDMIYLAYQETLNNTNKINFKYTDKILCNWKDQNVNSKADLAAVNSEREKKFNKSSNTKTAGSNKSSGWNSNEASYNIDKIKEKARGPLVYKRREG